MRLRALINPRPLPAVALTLSAAIAFVAKVESTPQSATPSGVSGIAATRFVYLDNTGRTPRQQVYLAGESETAVIGADGRDVVRYDAASDALVFPHVPEGALRRIDRGTAESLAADFAARLSAFEEELDSLPPEIAEESRQRFRELLGGDAGGSVAATTMVPTSERGSFAGYPCAWYELRAADESVGGACIAPPGSVPNDIYLLNMMRLVADVFSMLSGIASRTLGANVVVAPLLTSDLLTGLPLAITTANTDGTFSTALELVSADMNSGDGSGS